MSSRVLRKLQGEKENLPELNVDDGSDLDDLSVSPARGAKKKQIAVNRYDLLNQLSFSLSESEVKEDDDRETEAAADGTKPEDASDVTRKKKKKRKKKAVKPSDNKNKESDPDTCTSLGDIRSNSLDDGASQQSSSRTQPKDEQLRRDRPLLVVEHRHLNSNNEMKRIFGSKIIQAEQRKRGRGRSHVKSTWLVTPRDNWPQVGKPGVSMNLAENKNGILYFNFEHNSHYQQIQHKFLEAVESYNPDNIVSLINMHPYHVDALIQLSDLCKMGEDMQLSTELIERALYCLECAFHPLFNVAQGNCRLDYKRQENRSIFVALFKHLTFVGQRGCYRTALEFCKLLLGLDPEGDPLGALLLVDFYALRSQEYKWFLRLYETWGVRKNLNQLPNFAFSVAMAHYYLSLQSNEETSEVADVALQNALIMFPGVLTLVLDKCSIQPDARVASHSFFGPNAQLSQTLALSQLVSLYVERNYHLWKECDVMPWLERNVNAVLDRVDAGDPYVKECEQKRQRRYQGTPQSITRHILLSEIKNVPAPLPTDVQGHALSFDPLPPPDGTVLYSRPQRQRMYDNSSAFSMFFRSLLPNFNINEPAPNLVLDNVAAGGAPRADEEEAAGAASGVDLRRSVTSLLDAMRDLLSNIHLPDVPNDADVDDSDEERH